MPVVCSRRAQVARRHHRPGAGGRRWRFRLVLGLSRRGGSGARRGDVDDRRKTDGRQKLTVLKAYAIYTAAAAIGIFAPFFVLWAERTAPIGASPVLVAASAVLALAFDDAFWEWTMTLRIVQLGSDRSPGEGLRIGTVRRPPRGVKKTEYASKNFYDVWLPTLAPSAALVKLAQGARSGREWDRFMKKYRAEMTTAENREALVL